MVEDKLTRIEVASLDSKPTDALEDELARAITILDQLEEGSLRRRDRGPEAPVERDFYADLEDEIEASGDDAATVNYITHRLMCRRLNDQEQAIVLSSKKKLLAHYQSSQDHALELIAVGASKADEQLDVAELAAWTMVCNQLMNLDEVLNK